MSNIKKIKSALISVFNKDGLEPIVKKLNDYGVIIYSTGGTQKFINKLGIDVIAVEKITDYPSILGGRVKTLHPKIFGGILNRQENQKDINEMTDFNIPQIACERFSPTQSNVPDFRRLLGIDFTKYLKRV